MYPLGEELNQDPLGWTQVKRLHERLKAVLDRAEAQSSTGCVPLDVPLAWRSRAAVVFCSFLEQPSTGSQHPLGSTSLRVDPPLFLVS